MMSSYSRLPRHPCTRTLAHPNSGRVKAGLLKTISFKLLHFCCPNHGPMIIRYIIGKKSGTVHMVHMTRGLCRTGGPVDFSISPDR
jgi:hypothetical protein